MLQFWKKSQPPRQTVRLGQLIGNVFNDLHEFPITNPHSMQLEKAAYEAFKHGFVAAVGNQSLDEAIALFMASKNAPEELQKQMVFQGFAMGCAIAEHK